MASEQGLSFNDGGDLCLGFWKQVYGAGYIPVPKHAKVLEIGCAEADWLTPMKAERNDLHLTGIDWRPCERPGASVLIQGDVLAHDFAPSSFDVVVLVSALEHIGLGGYDNDPLDPDGDTHAMERILGWLVPGGRCYFDVPYRINGEYTVHGNFRMYHPPSLASRLIPKGLVVEYLSEMPSAHTDGPYVAVVLRKV